MQENQEQINPVIQKKSNFVVMLLSSLLLISCIIAGYFAYQVQKLNNELRILNIELKQKQTPEPTYELGLEPEEVPLEVLTKDWKTYTNTEYGFSFKYPKDWMLRGNSISKNNYKIDISVWRVSGFGYCYKYSEQKVINVDGIRARTADGVGTGKTEMCDLDKTDGNTYVLIPLEENSDNLPNNQVHLNYNYPLNELTKAKESLDQILSTFKFTK